MLMSICSQIAVFAKPKSQEQMPMTAPSLEERLSSIGAAKSQPFELNVSKTEESTRIQKPAFNLNSSKFIQGVQQDENLNPQLSGSVPKFDVSAFQQAPLTGAVQQKSLSGSVQRLQLLANYNIELIVDESMSMRKKDCPGGLSRWDWCGMQAGQLANLLAPFVRNGFTLTTFASDFQVYEKSSPQNVMELFNSPMFTLGTRMSKPLANRLDNFFAKHATDGKPLLIGVITDGVPAPKREPFLVVDVLIEATKRMRNQKDVTVVFFQVGSRDIRGKTFLNYLDNGLMADGARFDIVRNVPMERLQQVGLAQSLVESIQDYASKNKLGPISTPRVSQ
jgi:hypothetical protein